MKWTGMRWCRGVTGRRNGMSKMLKKYLVYLIKKYKTALIFLAIVYLFVMAWPQMDSLFEETTFEEGCSLMDATMNFSAIVSAILAFVLPVIVFRFVHSRKDEDQYFALPISRKTMLYGNLIFSYGVPAVYYFIGNLIFWIVTTAGGTCRMSVGKFVYYQAVGLVFGLALVLFNSMLYLLANNMVDGIILMLGYTMLPSIWELGVDCMLHFIWAGGYTGIESGRLFQIFSPAGMAFERLMTIHTADKGELWEILLHFALAIVYIVLCRLALQRLFVRRKAERAEQVSDGFFAYRLLLPMCLIPSVLVVTNAIVGPFFIGTYIGLVFLFVAYIVGSFIYKRQIRVTWKMILSFAVIILACVLLRRVGLATKAFGLAKIELPTDEKVISYRIQVKIPEYAEEIKKMGKDEEFKSQFEMYEDELGNDAEDAFGTVRFDVMLPRNNQTAIEKRLYEKLEKLRMESVDYYYKHNGEEPDGVNTSMFIYGGNVETGVASWVMEYTAPIQMSLEELREFCQDYIKICGSRDKLNFYANTPMGDSFEVDDLTIEELMDKLKKKMRTPMEG